MFKRMTADEAAMLVNDGDTVAFNGQVRIAVPERFYKALGDRFAKTGHPKGIKYLASSSYEGFNMWALICGLHISMMGSLRRLLLPIT